MEKYIVHQPIAETRQYVFLDCIHSEKSVEEIIEDYEEQGIYYPKVTLFSSYEDPIYDLDFEQHALVLESQA